MNNFPRPARFGYEATKRRQARRLAKILYALAFLVAVLFVTVNL